MYKLTGETFVTLANIRTVRHAFSPSLLIKIKGRSETVGSSLVSVAVKSAIDRRIAKSVGRKPGERSEYTRPELDQIGQNFPAIVEQALQQVFIAQN